MLPQDAMFMVVDPEYSSDETVETKYHRLDAAPETLSPPVVFMEDPICKVAVAVAVTESKEYDTEADGSGTHVSVEEAALPYISMRENEVSSELNTETIIAYDNCPEGEIPPMTASTSAGPTTFVLPYDETLADVPLERIVEEAADNPLLVQVQTPELSAVIKGADEGTVVLAHDILFDRC